MGRRRFQKVRYLGAMHAGGIPEGSSGRWTVARKSVTKPIRHPQGLIDRGVYTGLYCLTGATMHEPPGECVMIDCQAELEKHLEFCFRSHGDVLITGLGLGCVVRGVLVNSNVKSVTVIERSLDVIDLVRPYMPLSPRLTIIRDDAIQWCRETDRTFDCAWHDLWKDEHEEEHLQVTHVGMMVDLRRKCRLQGAWNLPREIKRRIQKRSLEIVG